VIPNLSNKDKEDIIIKQQNETSEQITRSTIMLEATGRMIGGLSTSYDEHYPLLLHGKVTKNEFKDTISKINLYMTNNLPLQTSRGCLPCFKKQIPTVQYEEKVIKILDEENKSIFSSKGVNWRFMKDGHHTWIEITTN